MSGHKAAVVTISQEEYRRLYEAERKMYFEQVSESRPEYDLSLEIQIQEIAQNIENRNLEFLELIKNVDQNLQIIEEETSAKALEGQYEVIDAYLAGQQNEITNVLNANHQQEQEIAERLNQVENENNQRFSELFQIVLENNNKHQRLTDTVNNYLDISHQLFAIIEDYFPHHINNSPQYAQIPEQLHLAEYDLDNGAEESALSLAQTAYLFLSSYKRNCENRYLEWQLLHRQVVSNLNLLLDDFQNNKQIQSIDRKGELQDLKIDLDYWSQGKANELFLQVKDMENYLVETGENVSFDDLKSIDSDFLIPARELFINTMIEARISALNAQIRYEIANTVLVALVEQGFKPVKGDFQNGNFLERYNASAVNPNGNEIKIFVDPGPANQVENSLHIISTDQKIRTEEELKSRAMEIKNSLIRQGLDVGAITTQTDEKELADTKKQNQEFRLVQQ